MKAIPRNLEFWLDSARQMDRIDVQFLLTKQVKRIGMEAARHESLNYIAGGSAGDVSHDTRSKIDEANRARVCPDWTLFRRAGKTIKTEGGIALTEEPNAVKSSELFRQIEFALVLGNDQASFG